MKNIFKKLHIGGSNHEPSSTNSNPNRSNETNNTTTGAHRSNETSNTSINNTSITSTTTGSTPTPPSIVSSISDHHHNQDYYTSEEEYQVQLALALSVSGRDSPDIQQIHAPILRDSPADLLSRQYWVGSCAFCFREFICI